MPLWQNQQVILPAVIVLLISFLRRLWTNQNQKIIYQVMITKLHLRRYLVKKKSIVCFSPAIKIPLKLNIGKDQKLEIKSPSAFSILIYYYWMKPPMLLGAVVGFITMGITSLAIPKKTQSEQHFLSLKK